MIFRKFMALVVAVLAAVVCVRSIAAFETDTHTLLSLQATDASQLNTFLTTVLGFEFQQGVSEEVGQGEFKKVSELIANVGAVDEDKPDIRSRTHFHDPTKAWAQAGLQPGNFESSILWSQNPNQGLTGKHSWQDARTSYYKALTATDKADRKKYYAETFVSLGHLIHLVQDAATPAHTRNDWHIGLTTGSSAFPALNVDRFHQWARKDVGEAAINGATSQPFDPSILTQNYDGLAPIAGIIDTTTSAGQGIPSNATNIGIAEFSNGNFFSDDTILRDYTFPNISQMDISLEPGPDGPDRSYLRKSFGPGPTDYRAAVATRLIEYIPLNFSPRQFELDDNIMADYGERLFPRAIGYSAGLIDYFFRGKIDSTLLTPSYTWVEWGAQSNSIRVENVKVKVDGTNESGQGTMRLVLLFRGTSSPETWFPKVIVSEPVSVSAGSAQTVVFSFSSLPYPMTAPPVYGTYSTQYRGMLVYKGSLGQETEAVVVDSSCIDTDGTRFLRHYRFEHGIGNRLESSGEKFTPWWESAYVEGC